MIYSNERGVFKKKNTPSKVYSNLSPALIGRGQGGEGLYFTMTLALRIT